MTRAVVNESPDRPPRPAGASSFSWLPTALSVGLVVLMASGCGGQTPPHEVAIDVESYLRRVGSWAPVEAELGRSVERIFATQFVDEAAILHELDEGEPRLDAQLRRIEAFEPRTAPVKDIHATYVEGWRQLERGYDRIRRGIARSDARELAAGRRALLGWRRTLRHVATQLRRLRGEYSDPQHGQTPT